MATLQKIRTKAGLLVAIVIGVSLAAFILGDLLRGGSSVLQRNRLKIGEIDGESIQYPEFQKEVEELGEVFKQNYQKTQLDEDSWAQVRDQTWQRKISEIVMGNVYEDLGISVSSDELFELIQGANPHRIIRQIFTNPETGQFNRSAVVSFLKNLETGVSDEQRQYWLNLETQITEERTQSKYAYMVAKGMYVTTEQAEESANAGGKLVNIDYVVLPYSEVSSDDISITEKNLKAYYNAHKDDYKSEKSRKIEYITFPVTPSEQDYADAEEWINDIKADFENTENTVQFVNTNSDIKFNNAWDKKDDLPEAIGKWVYDEKPETGAVYGPYKDGKSYSLAKLYKSEMMPDSVQARHILLKVNSQAEVASVKALADSLKNRIENGADFAKLARENSTDQGSAVDGGDLGWFQRGQMVKSFEEAAFNNTTDSVTIVVTQFGLHLVQTTKRGKLNPQVQVAFLTRKVEPSTKTYQDVYSKASKFAGENTTREAFETAANEQNLTKRVAVLGESDRQIPGLENARQLVRAAYSAEESDILMTTQESPIFDINDNFIIAVLTHASEEGIAPFEDVKARVELAVAKEKKAEILMKKAKEALNGNDDMLVLASALNTEVKSANGINFKSYTIPGVGLEPAVIGEATSLDVDKISTPIEGNDGVYIVMPTSIDTKAGADVATEKMRLAQAKTYRIPSLVFQAHKNAVEIEDYRFKFY